MESSQKTRYGKHNKICLVAASPRICMNNSYMFSTIKKFFELNSYEITDRIGSSDIIIMNTCGYTDDVADANISFIESVRQRHPQKKLVIFGCLLQIKSKNKILAGATLIGPKEIEKFSDIFECSVCISDKACHENSAPVETPEMPYEKNEGFIQISQGCSNACSYCNIKIAKTNIKSRTIDEIKEEAQQILQRGIREITLLADDCGSYGHDINTNIAELISALLCVDKSLKIRIYTIFPSLFVKYYPALKQFFEKGRIPYCCLPLQSGSPRVLGLMNRIYDLEKIAEIISDIKAKNPDTMLFTHFIINFPTETVEDFKKSINIAKIFDYSIFLPYGDNALTPASKAYPKSSKEMLHTKTTLAEQALINHLFNGQVLHEND